MDREFPQPKRAADPVLAVDADLQTVLTAWHDATVRWEQKEALLQAEVRRLKSALATRERTPSFAQERDGYIAHVSAQVARGVCHALAPVALHLQQVRRRVLDDATAVELLQKVERCCAAADSRIDDLLHLTTERPPMLRPVSLRALISDVHNGLRPQLLAQGVATTVDVPEPAAVLGDYEMLRQAVYNLTVNALEAMPAGGELVVTSFVGRSAVELEIADSGPGLSEEARRRAFEPFFTTKNGAGLGLAVTRRLVASHGGDVTATNCPDGGAAFTLRLPRRALEAAA